MISPATSGDILFRFSIDVFICNFFSLNVALWKHNKRYFSIYQIPYTFQALTSGSTSVLGTDANLFTGFGSTDATHGTNAIVISGLTAGNYDLYVYSQNIPGSTSNLSITANAVTGSITTDGNLTALSEGANYMKRTITVGGDGLLSISLGNTNQINGLQLQSSPTPEPASLVLLGVGGLFAARKKLRKKSA